MQSYSYTNKTKEREKTRPRLQSGQSKQCNEFVFFEVPLLLLAKRRTCTIKFENYELCFFYEILILITTKNIKVCCFLVIRNQS